MKLKQILELLDKAAYQKAHFKKLIGKAIGMNEAASKYGVGQDAISRWTRDEHIQRIGIADDDPTKVWVNEADVAYAAVAFKALKVKRGQKLFNTDHSLYIPRHLLNGDVQ